jgi:hypothetical protein
MTDEHYPEVMVAETTEEKARLESTKIFRYGDAPGDSSSILYVKDQYNNTIATLRIIWGGDDDKDWKWGKKFSDMYNIQNFSEFASNSLAILSGLFLDKNWQDTNVLGALIKEGYVLCRERDVRFIFCQCAPSQVQLYEQLGFRRYKGNFNDPEKGYQIPLVLVAEDINYLDAVRSPFYIAACKLTNTPETSEWFNRQFPIQIGYFPEMLVHEDELWNFLSKRSNIDSIPLFHGLTESEINKLYKASYILLGKANDRVVRAGEIGHEMFLLLSGAVDVRRTIGGRDYILATFGKGQIFGEMAFLSKTARSADIVALTNFEILVLSQEFLKKIMDSDPNIAMKILFNLSLILCERLKTCSKKWLNDQISQFQRTNTI